MDKDPTVINGMLLCKSRFWMIAKIRYEKCWYKDLTDALQAGCSLVSPHLRSFSSSSN